MKTLWPRGTAAVRIASIRAAFLMMVLALGVASARAELAPGGELRVMRVDYFQNYAGSFLAVEVFDALASADASSSPAVSFAWRTAAGAYGPVVDVPRYVDSVSNPGAYLYNRTLVRVGAAGAVVDAPVSVRFTSSAGAVIEAPVRPWLASSGPPHARDYLRNFVTRYMNPTEAKGDLAALFLTFRFTDLVSIVNLPNLTDGYQRKSQALLLGSASIGQTGALSATEAQQAVVVESVDYGQDGGNQVQIELRAQTGANQPLSAQVNGKLIEVFLASDASGAPSSTAAQVVAAINANPAAAAILKAYTYRGAVGNGISLPRSRVNLSDFLNAPASVARGPFQIQALRIGAHRDGTKVGVLIYCQQRGSDWVTPLTCVETAERLLRNYGTDALTTQLLDNLDIFIVPTVNPDGGHYSFYDNNDQRRNMIRRCPQNTFGDPGARHLWGVDINRNNTVGTLADGYVGAVTDCTSDAYAGPSVLSEPETRNEHWIVDTYPNIRFSLNVQSAGGYLTWSPGAYSAQGRVTLPAPQLGLEAFHFANADYILSRVKESRGTAILPQRVGALADVRASEAGNSADDQWYRRSLFAYTLAVGADRFASTISGTGQSAVGVRPDFSTEGGFEAQEFADGAMGLLERAYAYAIDVTPPSVDIVPNGSTSPTPVTATFSSSEPATVHYTLDGSTPTLASPTWDAERPRLPGSALMFTRPTTVKWIGADMKGNVSAVRSAQFVVDSGHRMTGTAYNFPETATYRATFSVDASGPATPAGSVKYSYTRTRMNFASTSLSAVSFNGATARIEGAGTVNGVAGYSFTATATDGSPDAFGLVIRKPDATVYFSAAPAALAGGSFETAPQ